MIFISFSIVVYEIVTRQRAFVGSALPRSALMQQVKVGKAKPDSLCFEDVKRNLSDETDKRICSQLCSVSKRCWESDANLRPSMEEGRPQFAT